MSRQPLAIRFCCNPAIQTGRPEQTQLWMALAAIGPQIGEGMSRVAAASEDPVGVQSGDPRAEEGAGHPGINHVLN